MTCIYYIQADTVETHFDLRRILTCGYVYSEIPTPIKTQEIP